MIPKTIHYCWLSNDPFPPKIRRCMETWQRTHPDYTVKRWSTENFDVNAVPYVREAYRAGKWAFAADYIRLHALYTEGGIYLDSDVRLLKSLTPLLDCQFFSSMEYHPIQIERCGSMAYVDADGHRTADVFIEGIQIQAAVMGAEKGSPFVAEIMEWYKDKHFVRPDGTLATDVLSPQIYARVAERHGFIYKDCDQQLPERIHIYPSEVFAGNKHEVTPRSRAIHLCAHSWHLTPWEKLRRLLGISKRYKQ